MANTVDENMVAFLKADATVSRLCGGRIHKNKIKQGSIRPHVWFARESSEQEDTLDDANGAAPFRHFYDVEIVADTNGEADRLAEAVRARCHLFTGTFGDSTVKRIFAEVQDEQYEPHNVGGDTGLHVPSLRVQVVP